MTKKLEGKTAVITGGTEGIGFANAKLFVEEGAYVFIRGRRQKELDEAVKAIGANVSGVQGDVARLADLDPPYKTASKVKRRIDIIFANAGVGEFVAFGAVTEEHFDKLFNINVRGTLFEKDPEAFFLAALFAPSDTGQAAGEVHIQRIKARKVDRDPAVSLKSGEAQVRALKEWGTVPSSDRYAL
jgi:NAD(P)-dependent dehydrogenase (short-subunit alcohol dehydrogenase family)